jgi:hypothetical protein
MRSANCLSNTKLLLVTSGRLMKVNATMPVLFITSYAKNTVVGNGHLDTRMLVIMDAFGMTALANEVYEMTEMKDMRPLRP